MFPQRDPALKKTNFRVDILESIQLNMGLWAVMEA